MLGTLNLRNGEAEDRCKGIDSIEQSPSWKDRHSTCQEISCLSESCACWEEPDTGHYPEPDETNPPTKSPFIKGVLVFNIAFRSTT